MQPWVSSSKTHACMNWFWGTVLNSGKMQVDSKNAQDVAELMSLVWSMCDLFHVAIFVFVHDWGQPRQIRRSDLRLRGRRLLHRWHHRLPQQPQVQTKGSSLLRRRRPEPKELAWKSQSRHCQRAVKWPTDCSRRSLTPGIWDWLSHPSHTQQSWWKKCSLTQLSLRALVAYICVCNVILSSRNQKTIWDFCARKLYLKVQTLVNEGKNEECILLQTWFVI